MPRQINNCNGWLAASLTMIMLLICIPQPLVAAPQPITAHPKPLPQSSSEPLVVAFYYTWFDEHTWSYDQLSDLPAEPYVSRDRAVMGRHIDQAKAAGIDAFLVAWYGPTGEWNQTEPNLVALLEEAAARNFKIGILFETDSPFLGSTGAVIGALQHALSIHANQPAFLRVDGRPVLFFWRSSLYGVEAWRGIRSQVDPGYGSFWIAEGVDTSWLAVFDGHHLYSNTWNPPADLTYTNQKFAQQVAAARQRYGSHKIWVATVMPGYNDLRIRPGNGFAKDREGGAYYERAWQAAIASQPNWIVINSFNEWPEGTYIEPSVAHGGHYLGLTAAWSSQFKAGGGQTVAVPVVAAAAAPVTPLPVATAAPLPTPTPYPASDSPIAYVQTPILNLRAGPGTDPYAILGQVAEDQVLPIVGHNEEETWWQVRLNIDGDMRIAWISAAYVYATGPLAAVPVVAPSPLTNVTIPSLESSVTATPVLVVTPDPVSVVNSASRNADESHSTQPEHPSTYDPKLSRNP